MFLSENDFIDERGMITPKYGRYRMQSIFLQRCKLVLPFKGKYGLKVFEWIEKETLGWKKEFCYYNLGKMEKDFNISSNSRNVLEREIKILEDMDIIHVQNGYIHFNQFPDSWNTPVQDVIEKIIEEEIEKALERNDIINNVLEFEKYKNREND